VEECVKLFVRLILTNGTNRTVENADSARSDGPFFIVARSAPDRGRIETVLTLRAQDVIAAEIYDGAVVIDRVLGTSRS